MKFLHILLLVLQALTLNASVDTIIFSKDRPMQLYALLESMYVHIQGLGRISVLCHAQNDAFYRGYQVIQQQFPQVRFVFQNRENPRADFLSHVKSLVHHSTSPFLMFAVDDIIMTNPVDLNRCSEVLAQTKAYGFYLRLGRDIDYSYAAYIPSPQPPFHTMGNEYVLWELKNGISEWEYPHSVDMTIYPRKTVEQFLAHCRATSPNTLEAKWSQVPIPDKAHGICYTTSRLINIPCNLVQQDYKNNRHAKSYDIHQLLNFFMQGYRIDINVLRNYPHHAPHVEVVLPFK